MAKIHPATASLLAIIEERGAQIREMERREAGFKGMIGKLEIDLAAKDEQIEKIIEKWTQRSDEYRGLWEDALAKLAQVQGVIATMDTKAIEIAEAKHRVEISQKDRQIETLKEDLHRCLGWISAQRGQHPGISHVRPGERFDDSRAMTQLRQERAPDQDGDPEIPF